MILVTIQTQILTNIAKGTSPAFFLFFSNDIDEEVGPMRFIAMDKNKEALELYGGDSAR